MDAVLDIVVFGLYESTIVSVYTVLLVCILISTLTLNFFSISSPMLYVIINREDMSADNDA